jgi:6-pyruvoyl tetrahydropterin synthase/QueD family protein
MTTVIAVRHNMEMAHRLSLTPGKCENIHGHSWWCTLKISGKVSPEGMVLEFGGVKQHFRRYLDTTFDHHLCLYEKDPLIVGPSPTVRFNSEMVPVTYPGISLLDRDPTTENIAKIIHEWSKSQWGPNYHYEVELWETSVNMARVGGPL